jgi:ADP-ribosylglycohydrolase
MTDDTQMTLFTAENLIRAFVRQQERGVCSISAVVHHAHRRWLLTQREGGHSCEIGTDGWLYGKGALRALRAATSFGVPDLAHNKSKGCGGVMRVAPVGLFWPVIGSDAAVFELGKKTAALTHGHPSGMLSAGHFALMIAALSRGEPLRSAVDIACADLRKHEVHEEVMDSVRSAVRLADSKQPREPETLSLLGEG